MSTNSRSTSSPRGSTQSRPSTTSSTSSAKARQYTHLNAQLAQLSANMADFENIMKMTAVQARAMRELGGYAGALLMASSKVLGEETVVRSAAAGAAGIEYDSMDHSEA